MPARPAVKPALRPAIDALWALDATLGQVLRSTREPMLGQIRLAWWHAALIALDTQPPPAQPLLQALHRDVLPRGVSGAALAEMADAWETLIEPTLDEDRLLAFARGRGGGLFAAAAQLLSIDDARVIDAGTGWALADLARNLSVAEEADRARLLALTWLDRALSARWPRHARPLVALAHRARADLSPARTPAESLLHRLRGALHGLTGR